MRALFENKRLILLLAVLALGALTVLAVSLNGMPFREGQQFARSGPEEIQAPIAPLPELQVGIPDLSRLVVLALLVLLAVLIGALLSPAFRKRLFWLLLKALVWGVAIYLLVTRVLPQILMAPQAGVGGAGPDNASLT